MKKRKLKPYILPEEWKISFPQNWIHEIDLDDIRQDIFYPPDSELTIRITTFHIEKDNKLASANTIETIFLKNIPKKAEIVIITEYEIKGYSSKAFLYHIIENEEKVYLIRVGFYGTGTLFTMNIFSNHKDECYKALIFLKTLFKIS